MDTLDFSRESAIPFPDMSVKYRTQRNWILKPILVSVKKRFLILKIKGLCDELKTFEEIVSKTDNQKQSTIYLVVKLK